ncbi:hypothetical protein DXG01_015229 [Tephrocybe rancida]|nr:hypothetical protein DXG01_015229 [Tephrocybe rancida]
MQNEELIKYAWPQDVWFHVDKLSSAHVYIRMPDGMTFEGIPEALLTDCAQLVKANSIEVHVAKRENPIVNRLNKTKVEKVVDHEQERVDRIKAESSVRRAAAAEKKKADLELARQREAEKAARSYDTLFNAEDDEEDTAPRKTGRELEEDFM